MSTTDVKQVIAALGGQTATADKIGALINRKIRQNTVYGWQKNNDMPEWWSFIIRNHADELGIEDKSVLRYLP